MNRQDKAIYFLNSHCFNFYDTTFPFSLILNSLNENSSFKLLNIKNKITSLLIKEKNNNQSFNYWFKHSKKYSIEPYPNDLDDTFCAWIALSVHNYSLLGQEEVLALSKLLICNQYLNGGPYCTWIVNHRCKNSWNDVDFVVNLNIARFLSSQRISLNGLNNFIEEKIKSEDLGSIYYKGELPSLYFLSYFYNGAEKIKLKEKFKFYLQQEIEDSSILLLYIGLLRFNFFDLIKEKDLQKIFSLQREDGSVAGFDFYNYENKATGEKFYKSSLISTALFLEFLSLLEKRYYTQEIKKESCQLLELFKRRLLIFNNKSIKSLMLCKALPIIKSKNSDFSIFLIQRLMSSVKNKVYLPKNVLLSLSLINLFAWIAYTIYDDINDLNDNVKYLPLANMGIQLLIQEFSYLPKPIKNLCKISNLFVKMELNNLRENNFFIFDKNFFIKLSKIKEKDLDCFSIQKSCAQIFSLYFFLDYLKIKDQEKIVKIFQNITLLKQINDDLKDCFTDLKNKKINLVNYHLLKEFNFLSGEIFYCQKDEKILKEIFIKKTAPIIFKKNINLINESKTLLNEQNLFLKNNFFMKILSKYEKIALEDMRKNTLFINLSN